MMQMKYDSLVVIGLNALAYRPFHQCVSKKMMQFHQIITEHELTMLNNKNTVLKSF